MNQKVIIFSAPSGAGKTTIVQHILQQFPILEFSVSATSRQPRTGEVNGKDYYFLEVEKFKQHIEKNDFLEWEEVYNNQFYGTLLSEIDRIWAKDKVIIFDVDVKGGVNIKKHFGNKALSIFVQPPSIAELEERLQLRNTETPESLKKRIARATSEMEYAILFDKIVINDKLEKALQETKFIVQQFIES